MRILSLTCSATGCERNWSTFDQVHTKRRNRLEQQRLNALVFVKYNLQLEMRQKSREDKGDTYDLICLFDIKSNDEWITKKENPCLLIDALWMDVHECFDIDEEASSKEERNLNVKVDKGKSIIQDEDEIQDNEEGEELILDDEDELSDVDVGDMNDCGKDKLKPKRYHMGEGFPKSLQGILQSHPGLDILSMKITNENTFDRSRI
ncbi:hypothetical protein CR513_60875, partial [Mucuna pruriens]